MKKLTPQFVDYMPRPLEDGILYISIRFRIVSHNCCCGCGNEVVTNLSPQGWQLTYDGESVSLHPSIWNRDFPCGSHYWIVRNRVKWALSRSSEEVNEEWDPSPRFEKGGNLAEKPRKPGPEGKRSFWSRVMRKGR